MPAITPVGGEILVNATTAGTQSAPSAAALGDGHYVITWTNTDRTIWARILNSDGTPAGSDIPISSATETYFSSVAALSGGGFVAAWTDNNGATRTDVRARLFANDGTPTGAEFTIHTTTAGSQTNIDLAALPGGGFVATWSSFGAGGNLDGVFARLFAANGSPTGSEFKVDAAGATGTSPSVTALSGGGFAIAWEDFEGGARNIRARAFDGNGLPTGAIIPIDHGTSGSHYDPEIAALPGGGFVVTWKNASAPGGPSNVIEIDAQVLAAGGSAVTGVFAVNTHPTSFDPQGLTVQSFADGHFLIIWPDHSGTTGDSDQGAIVGQLYDPGGTPIGVEFRINTQTANGQFDGAITTDAGGTFLVAWTDQGPSLGVDIRAQQLALPQRQLFDDGSNTVDFNLVQPSDFAGPYNDARNGSDVVQLPNDSGDLAIWGIANGFFGGDGNDALTEGAVFLPLFGGAGDDTLTGNTGHDILSGGAGADVLRGLGGVDELIGGTGDDIYFIDWAGDTIVENKDEGTDTVHTTLASYALRDNLENLIFVGTGPFSGTGNAAGNVIVSVTNAPSELNGGAGDDTYVVSIAGDTIVEQAGGGTDIVRTGLAFYALRDNLENLTFVGTGPFSGTGNALDNVMTGGTGAASELNGGGGNDSYIVSAAGDTIVEQAGGGTDTVRTALSYYRLGAEVENLTYTGTGRFTGIGNALDNVITGGAASDDYLYAGAGADTLIGGAGADVFLFDAAVAGIDAILDFASGSDRIFLNGAVFAHGASFNLVQGPGALSAPNGDSTFFYHSDTGQIGYDADGTGAGAEIVFAVIAPAQVLAAADFHFY